MAMTAEQMIEFFGKQASSSMDAVAAAPNAYMVTFNIGQCFENYLMQGLIGWRTGLACPVEPVRAAVLAVRDYADGLQDANDLPLERAAIVSFLIDEPLTMATLVGLGSDRLLDAVIAVALRNNFDQEAWDTGMAQLRKTKGSSLAVETYSVYRSLLTGSEMPGDLISKGEQLFQQRSKNSYYSGGLQSNGGGPDNLYTVDYRLAAILKKVGFTGESMHLWRWS